MDTPLKQKRQPSSALGYAHPLLRGPEARFKSPLHVASKGSLSEFTQRVMSGKLLQMHCLQNQLSQATKQLEISKEENRALSRIVKRQELQLRRCDGEGAAMPRLLRAHSEEVRILRTTVRDLRSELRTLRGQLGEKEAQITSLKDALVKLKTMAEDNHLFDQEKARKKLNELQEVSEQQSRELQVLSRKLLLETKNYQRQLTTEIVKHKQTRQQLNEALDEIDRLHTIRAQPITGPKPTTRSSSGSLKQLPLVNLCLQKRINSNGMRT